MGNDIKNESVFLWQNLVANMADTYVDDAILIKMAQSTVQINR
jgi:hypothetical protein